MADIKKYGSTLNLLSYKVDIEDSEYLSKYFVIGEFERTFTSGKNSFSINGSSLLKNNSDILVEVLDIEGNSLYVETSKVGYYFFSNADDLVFSSYIYNDTPQGFGQIVIVGTTIDNLVVRWIGNINILPYLYNKNLVRFYNAPEFSIKEFQSYVLNPNLANGVLINLSGSCIGTSIYPAKFSDLYQYDPKNTNFDYRITLNTTSSALSSELINNTINLYINTIQISAGKNLDVSATASFSVSNILNNNTININTPFSYNINGIEKICPIINAKYSIEYSHVNYITSSGVSGSNDSPDANIYLNGTQLTANGTETIFFKQLFADIAFNNIKTFSGNVFRQKVYRKSLNVASDFECISDEPLLAYETLSDESTPNRFYNNIGVFYNQFHVNRYILTSSANLTLIQDSCVYFNGLICSASNQNINSLDYIILKNDSSNITSNSILYRTFNYVPYDASVLTKQGYAYDSNFVFLYDNVDYVFSNNIKIFRKDISKPAFVNVYFTGSYNTSSVATDIYGNINYFNNQGLLLANYTINDTISTTQEFLNSNIYSILNFSEEMYGTLKIVPYNCDFILSDMSLKTYSDFSYSPDLFKTRIVFPITIPNEQYEIKAELFDINSNSIFSDITYILSFDPNGYTINKYNPIYSNYNIISGSNVQITGSLLVSGPIQPVLTVINTIRVQDSTNPLSTYYSVSPTNVSSSVPLIAPEFVSTTNTGVSFFGTASYAVATSNGGLTPGNTYPITASCTISASIAEKLSTFTSINLYSSASIDYAETTTTIHNGINEIIKIPQLLYNSAIFEYSAISVGNLQTGTIHGGILGASSGFTITPLVNIGDTSQLTMSMDLNSGYIRLLAYVNDASNWYIKSLFRYF